MRSKMALETSLQQLEKAQVPGPLLSPPAQAPSLQQVSSPLFLRPTPSISSSPALQDEPLQQQQKTPSPQHHPDSQQHPDSPSKVQTHFLQQPLCMVQAAPLSPSAKARTQTSQLQEQPPSIPPVPIPSVQDGVHVKQEQQSFPRPPQPFSPPHAFQQVYPAALATHDAVLADQSLFLDTLHGLHAALGIKATVPKIGGKDLDLHQLYKEVTCRGGLEVVIKDRKWKEITLAFNFPPTTTSASYVLRKNYISSLHHYEQVYFFGVQGQIISPPAAYSISSPVVSQLADADVNPEGSDEVESGVKKTKGIIDSAQALGVDPASSVGTVVTGAIDGKFDHGYLVTVMVGTRKMRGVLYHVPSTNTMPQNACVPALINNVGSELKPSDLGPKVSRRKRKRDISRKDPNAPRQNRTGYNFFFAEQRAKLKTLQPDKDRAISKMIGDLWNKLSEDEKTPYQEQGLKDKERYKSEMREYREKIKLPITHEECSKEPRAAIHEECSNEPRAAIQPCGNHKFGNGDHDHLIEKVTALKDGNLANNQSEIFHQSETSTSPVSLNPGYHSHREGLTLPV